MEVVPRLRYPRRSLAGNLAALGTRPRDSGKTDGNPARRTGYRNTDEFVGGAHLDTIGADRPNKRQMNAVTP